MSPKLQALLAIARQVDGLFGFYSIGTIAQRPAKDRALAAEMQAREALASGLRRLAIFTTEHSSPAELEATQLLAAAFERLLGERGGRPADAPIDVIADLRVIAEAGTN